MDQVQEQDRVEAVDGDIAAGGASQEFRPQGRYGDRGERSEGRYGDRGDRGEGRYGDRGDRGERRPESFEQMLRKFKKGVDNAGILKEVRARSFFESKSQKSRRKAAKAARRRTRSKTRTAE